MLELRGQWGLSPRSLISFWERIGEGRGGLSFLDSLRLMLEGRRQWGLAPRSLISYKLGGKACRIGYASIRRCSCRRLRVDEQLLEQPRKAAIAVFRW